MFSNKCLPSKLFHMNYSKQMLPEIDYSRTNWMMFSTLQSSA